MDGKWIAGGCQDGSIQLWSTKGKRENFGSKLMKGPFSRPTEIIRGAHKDNMDITCLSFSEDNFTMISRSMDDTMKVWDIRSTRKPVTEFDDLPNFGETK
jgi:WD40 repeat protein